ncbi:ABC transporter ATP-binding protein [Kitasatospora sp. NPDC058162]|uniref:ABC transporter ATP-binding protein n=1 Tax=Kitasatospora sp. NPDC058162 TaxID=3346362 RepID=UPI0036DCDE42
MSGSPPAEGPARRSVIELVGITRTYPGPSPVHALRPTDLTVGAGEYCTVVGPSGSGKSTLLNLLGLLDRPSEGTYLLDGVDTARLPEKLRTALRGRRIGFVFQSFHLLPYRTATDNVALAHLYDAVPRRQRRQAAREALARVGLGHRLDALPTTLSGGERQRVAIARALVHHPSLLLCDEPTGNLDSATAAQVLDLFDLLHGEGMTLLVITHDAHTAARGQRTLTIRDGVLTETRPVASAHG